MPDRPLPEDARRPGLAKQPRPGDQEQFLHVLDRDEAERRFRGVVDDSPRGIERIGINEALARVLAVDVTSPVDVPSFDRANVDGFAVVAQDTHGASEEQPKAIRLGNEVIHTGIVPASAVASGTAVAIATGGMMPRGADAVVMIEHADADHGMLFVRRAVTAGSGVSFAGTDITARETVVRQGQVLTSRDTGVLAAIGVTHVDVWRRPIVAILSTGDEIIAPGEPMRPSRVYDSNAQVLADAVRELGGEPLRLGIVADDENALRAQLRTGLERADVVLLSGGTSKGAGDVSYRIVAELRDPGIVAHGVALKPGKPICLAATGGKPVVVLPGFPTSAIFTFHEFVAPVISAMAGRPHDTRATVQARLAVKVNSEIGRTEYLLVRLVEAAEGTHDVANDTTLVAYPMGQGSGSVTTFSRADGFTTIDRHEEIVPAGTTVTVHLLGRELQLADLVVIGSHCVGLDYLLGRLQQEGVRSTFLAVGSLGGLEAAKRGECDIAGIHLLNAQTGEYNQPFLTPALELIPGYGRLQGIVFRKDDARFANDTVGRGTTDSVGRGVRLRQGSGGQVSPGNLIQAISADASIVMVNRNQGSGTRALIDRLLGGARPPGYAVQPRNHNAVAAAVAQGRADWGVTLDTIAAGAGLGFIPIQHEQYDFVTPVLRAQREGVRAFRALLERPDTKAALAALGMEIRG
jgi:putative molybdopterin biosynthesis protein